MKQKEIVLTAENLVFDDIEIGSWGYSDGQLCYSCYAQMYWPHSVYVGPANEHISGPVEIPSEVTIEGRKYRVIGISSFQGCALMTSIFIPSSVMTVSGGGLFAGCDSLESVVVEQGNRFLDSRDGCNAIIITEQNLIVAGCKNSVIPSSVSAICESAFQDCCGLMTLSIPADVLYIGDNAFAGCTGLESIIVSSDNAKYDSRENCNAIIETESNRLIVGCANTKIPQSVSIIGDNAFAGTSIGAIEIPEGITIIGYCAFGNCTNLKQIKLPESLQFIDESAFAHSGIESIHIPIGVTDMDGSPFMGCDCLESIRVDSDNPVLDSRDNCNAIIHTSTNKLICGCKNTIIPPSVTAIGEKAFEEHAEIKSIVIPCNVQEIEQYAFYGCKNLNSVRTCINNPEKCFVHISSFMETGDSTILFVPEGKIEAYRHAKGGWQLFNNKIQEYENQIT